MKWRFYDSDSPDPEFRRCATRIDCATRFEALLPQGNCTVTLHFPLLIFTLALPVFCPLTAEQINAVYVPSGVDMTCCLLPSEPEDASKVSDSLG